MTTGVMKALSISLAVGWVTLTSARPADINSRGIAPDISPRATNGTAGELLPVARQFVSNAPADFNLKDSASFYFGRQQDFAIAKVSADAVDADSKLFWNGQFQDYIQATHCGTDGVNVVFKNKEGYNAVKQPLGWLYDSKNHTSTRSITFVADDTSCGNLGRGVYKMNSVTYDDKNYVVWLNGNPIDWDKATKNLTIDIDTRGIVPHNDLNRRKIDESIDLSKFDQSGKTIYSGQVYNGINASVTCDKCGLEGTVHLQAHADFFSASATGSLDATGMALNFGLGLKLEASIPEPITWDGHLPQIPLMDPPISILGFTFGPALVLGTQASIDELSASLELGPIGGKLSFPNDPHFEFDVSFSGMDGGATDGSFSPQFESFDPQLTLQVNGKGSISPYMALGVGVTTPGKKGASAGVILDAPKFGFQFEAGASSGDATCAANLGLSLEASIDAEIDFFAGMQSIENAQDIVKKQLYSQNIYSHSWCFALGGSDNNGGDGDGGSGDAGGSNGADQLYLEWFMDTQYSGNQQAFWAAEDSKCYLVAPDFQKQISSLRISQSTQQTGGCLFWEEEGCTGDGFWMGTDAFSDLTDPSGDAAFLQGKWNDRIVSWKCATQVIV